MLSPHELDQIVRWELLRVVSHTSSARLSETEAAPPYFLASLLLIRLIARPSLCKFNQNSGFPEACKHFSLSVGKYLMKNQIDFLAKDLRKFTCSMHLFHSPGMLTSHHPDHLWDDCPNLPSSRCPSKLSYIRSSPCVASTRMASSKFR